ncbi:hypothetical protein ACEZCY_29765 [Streptacidiphilus sp. N1-12]|uniref:Uncharacterized protein n=2 Tax=Streptacidiphilus alkalitolerans TaxID=3342712 RepID=A0ABV6X693_9ACTN
MKKEDSVALEEQQIGARRRSEVEREHRDLDAVGAAPHRQTQFVRGALTGYVWALGHADAAPITGLREKGVPSTQGITAEVDATLVQLASQPLRTVPRDYVQGVHDALAWVCGFQDEPPGVTEQAPTGE